MGKGIALQFKKRFPGNFKAYAADEVRGHRCHAEGDLAPARTHFDQAMHGFQQAGQPRDVARCKDHLNSLET